MRHHQRAVCASGPARSERDDSLGAGSPEEVAQRFIEAERAHDSREAVACLDAQHRFGLSFGMLSMAPFMIMASGTKPEERDSFDKLLTQYGLKTDDQTPMTEEQKKAQMERVDQPRLAQDVEAFYDALGAQMNASGPQASASTRPAES